MVVGELVSQHIAGLLRGQWYMTEERTQIWEGNRPPLLSVIKPHFEDEARHASKLSLGFLGS